MTAAEALLRLRPAARFDPDRPVPGPLLARLMGLAARAPSSHNLQPWRFLVLRDRGNLDRLRRCAFDHPALAGAPAAVVVLGYLHPHLSHWPEILDRWTERAGLSAEQAGRLAAEVRRDLAAEPDLGSWACRHATAALTALQVAAVGLGLAIAPIDRFERAALRDAFGIPRDHVPCAVIALGYPADSHGPPDPGRLPLAELCFEEHFGQPWRLGEAEHGEPRHAPGAGPDGDPPDAEEEA